MQTTLTSENIQAKYEARVKCCQYRVIKKLICMVKYRTALSEHASFQCFKGGMFHYWVNYYPPSAQNTLK
jgi:hypothetical protein